MSRKTAAAILVTIVLTSILSTSQAQRWVLPVADGGGKPSPPSVHGYVADVAKGVVTVRRDAKNGAPGDSAHVQLASRTEFFTASGGAYNPNQLRAGQYVWVWYVTADPAKAGTPPRAAVVMLWSTDPSDKPDKKTRWSFDSKK